MHLSDPGYGGGPADAGQAQRSDRHPQAAVGCVLLAAASTLRFARHAPLVAGDVKAQISSWAALGLTLPPALVQGVNGLFMTYAWFADVHVSMNHWR